MDTYRAQIRSVLEAVQIEVPSAFLWFGKRYECSPRELGRRLNEEQQVGLLLLCLQDHLYRHFYCSGGVACHAVTWDSAGSPALGRFVVQLGQANSGRGLWDPDWRVCTVDSAVVGLVKDGLTLHVPHEHCRMDQGRPPAIGATAALWHPKGSYHRCPGFYMVYGEEPFEPAATYRLLRVYWNVEPGGAAELVRTVTRRLNDSRIPFSLKLLDDPRRYARCDSAVLYVAKASYAAFSADHLNHIRRRVGQHLASSVPALTKPLCPGVSIAENPARHGSFGADRCRALAEGIVSACQEQGISVGETVERVESRFRQSGIDPARPYLNLGSSDDYEAIDLRAGSVAMEAVPERRCAPFRDERCLVAAHEIGRLIVDRAVWHGDECNWIGALGPSSQASPVSRVGGLGTDLYDGTAGIALFLGQLFTVTGDRKVRETALGAIRHALAHCRRSRPERCGLYVGPLGIAVVAARLGMLLDREDLLRGARRLARAAPPADIDFDLISGAAGSIIGYVILCELLEDEVFLEAAYVVGKRLVATAISSPRGVSWRSGHSRGRRNLTGLSHGAAGAAYSLLEVFALSGDDRFKSTAEAAFDYERSCFEPREGNWPDFREVDEGDDDRMRRVPFSNTWCHGAPGIAVSRVRAAQVLPGGSYLGEARVALNTTRDHLRSWLRSGRANYSLCHGVAGNADVLLSALRAGVPIDCGAEEVIRETAEVGLEAYSVDHSLWPCGAGGGGANPSLMLGWAGIGHFYLRLARKDVPTPLAPHQVSRAAQGR
jgi:hypothetical protein